jgi:N-acetylglutamate synthase-like GNAT family acetyltransferase
MRIRKALPEDILAAVALAAKLGLDYPGMEADRLWVAEDAGRVVGLVALKSHPDCLELCALGVDEDHRGQGIARALVEALMAETPGAVHLATVIPGFFEACGFSVTADVPLTFPAKRKTPWCDGCPKDLCTVMAREKP